LEQQTQHQIKLNKNLKMEKNKSSQAQYGKIKRKMIDN
jgi:hypothetical protein